METLIAFMVIICIVAFVLSGAAFLLGLLFDTIFLATATSVFIKIAIITLILAVAIKIIGKILS